MNRFLRDSYWHLLCHRTELPESGDYLRLQWLGEDVVVANDQGDLIVFDNVCPHRGARFFSNDSGNGPVSCPYHGWTFRGGELHIPCRHKFREQELNGLHIGSLNLAWCGDFLFASVKPLKSLESQLAGMFDRLAAISMDIYGRHDWNAYTYNCDWKIAIENGLDSLHTPFVHTNSLGRLHLSDPVNYYEAANSLACFEIADPQMLRRLKTVGKLFQLSEQFQGYMSMFIFPFTMLTSTFGYSYSLQHFFPAKESGQTGFYSRLLKGVLRPGLDAAALQHFFDSTAQVNRMVFEEDHAVCRQIDFSRYDWRDLSRLSEDEEKIAHFRRSLQAIAPN
ncbi:aromatic ring-hydroxylating oxygenase subunit alpha [Undibacterium luofuense]|uniref:Rieske 2Fe-2S domain-containing protein n=1 Tax=Undibacterium luofuense TaxID=2828733 RepID=A0A941DJK8_9BURK|nr:Rieske 2Fe-2S domain-containing protein [Undibacterium luofuense]MBR7781170.1 Rieske 2Fe-2S domain-containing protein [Undibacterium luofuense]